MWYLIESTPDLCTLTNFNLDFHHKAIMIQVLHSVDNSAGFILTFIIRLSFTLYSPSYIMIQVLYTCSVDNSAGCIWTFL